MAEYIKKEDIEQKIQDGLNNLVFGHDAIEVLEMIYEMPAADVAPVRHGRWIKNGVYYSCSQCGRSFHYRMEPQWWNYCPQCGDMIDK